MGQGSETLGDMYDFYEFEDDFYEKPFKQIRDKNSVKSIVRGSKVEKTCDYCEEKHMVRTADLDRGWGKFCSKSCKAKEQEKRTHQNRNYLINNS